MALSRLFNICASDGFKNTLNVHRKFFNGQAALMMMVAPKTKQYMFKTERDACGSIAEYSTEDEKTSQSEGKLIEKSSQDFKAIKDMPGFVDHTHFIGGFLLSEQRLAIFAPRRFGKTSHLDMTKIFLNRKYTEEPYKKTNDEAVNRENYKYFENTNIIKNVKYRDIVNKYLGKYPVIHLDLKEPPEIYNVGDAQRHFRNAIQEAYKEHPYLISSEKLTGNIPTGKATAQRICDKWCDGEEYKNLDLDKSLINLAEYLYNHFDKTKVFVLVDEFDAVNQSALRNARNVEEPIETQIKRLTAISSVITEPLCKVTKGNHEYIASVLITGVSYMAGIGNSPGMNNIKRFRFLEGNFFNKDDKDFVPFYGATKEEVESLVEKLVEEDQLTDFKRKKEFLNDQEKLDAKKIMDDLKSRYNGYVDKKGTRIFSLWSVLQYLQTGEPRNFWNETSGIEATLIGIFRSPAIAQALVNLIRGETIEFNRLDTVEIRHLLELEQFVEGKRENVNKDVVFNYLMDHGYVSYAEDNKFIKIPNSEVRNAFSRKLTEVLANWNFDSMSISQLINRLPACVGDESALKNNMKEIQKKLDENLKMSLSKNPNHVNEAMIMAALHEVMSRADSFEMQIDKRLTQPGTIVSFGRPDYFLWHKNSNFCIMWELKNNKDQQQHSTSKFALQEARGIESLPSKKAKDYMIAIEELKVNVLVVGLSVDNNLNVSISFALNNDPTIFCITKEENIKHSHYYSDCIML